MKSLRRILSLLIVLAMLSTLTFAADPLWPCASAGTQAYSADPWTRTLITDNQYGLKYFNDSDISNYRFVSGDTNATGSYKIHDIGATFWNSASLAGIGKDTKIAVPSDSVNPAYRGNVINNKNTYRQDIAYGGVYFGSNSISTKKFSISFQTKVDAIYANMPVVDIELFNGDEGAYSSSTVIAGKSGHATRKNFMLELRTDGTNAASNPNAASMFHGTHVSETGGSAIAIGFDDTDWHYVEAVVDVTNGIQFAKATLYFDGVEVFSKTGDFITDNGFDFEGNLKFNAMLMSLWSFNKNSHANIDNVKIVDLTGDKFGVMNVIEAGNEIYLELTNNITDAEYKAAAPQLKLKNLVTGELYEPAVSYEGYSALKLDLSGLTLDDDTEYQIVYPEDIVLSDVCGRAIDKEKIITIYKDGAGIGVREARILKLDNSAMVPSNNPSNGIKAFTIKTDTPLSAPTATLMCGGDSVSTTRTGSGTDWTFAWSNFLAAAEHTLTISDGVTPIYSYTFTPVVSDSLEISDFAIYDGGSKVTRLTGSLVGKTITLKAKVINPTGTDKKACVFYTAYKDGYLVSAQFDDNSGQPLDTTFEGTELSVSYTVTDCDEIQMMLLDGLGTMSPLTETVDLKK